MAAVPKGFMPNISGFQASEAVSEGARRATVETASEARPPNPEVIPARRTRRQYSAPEKTALLAEADECEARGDLGGFLRRRRIYASTLLYWRRLRASAEPNALVPKKRGPKPNPSARQVQSLNRDVARLRRKLERAEQIIKAQKKLCVALDLPIEDETSDSE